MLKLAEIFQSGMVLQRDKEVVIWGNASANAKIDINVQNQQKQVIADEFGRFECNLDPLNVSENEVLIVSNDNEKLVIEDIAVGEVWLAGGQSNMEFFMAFEKHYHEEIVYEEDTLLRFYDVPEVSFEGQREAFDYSEAAKWRKATKEDLGYFSAVGYYFQKYLKNKLNVPVGIIGCNWGGTTASAWMKPATVELVGNIWMQAHKERIKDLNLTEYYETLKKNEMCNRGLLINEPFGQFCSPVTRTIEEVAQRFGEGDFFNIIHPTSFPGSLYKHMLLPISKVTVKGVLWYQGESDDDFEGGADIYDQMLTGLIGDWRELLGQDIPFFIVQLPGWESWLFNCNKQYHIIRACQEQVCQNVDHTYLCSIGDVGEQYDIHPKNKKVVGQRLSLLALNHIYGFKNLVCDAPVFNSATWKDSDIVLSFKNANILKIMDDTINALELIAENKKIDYTFEIEGNNIVLHVSDINNIDQIQILFAQSKWYTINLYNEGDIPAIPFKTVLKRM